jgi:hypothetical protein
MGQLPESNGNTKLNTEHYMRKPHYSSVLVMNNNFYAFSASKMHKIRKKWEKSHSQYTINYLKNILNYYSCFDTVGPCPSQRRAQKLLKQALT